MIRIIVSAAAVAVALTAFGPRPAQAYAGAPWCAVVSTGTGTVYWDCQYGSFEACYPNVLAGNRGFCNQNPAYTGPVEAHRAHYARHRHPVRHN